MEKLYNPYDNVLKIVEEAADTLGYTNSDIEAIGYPERGLKVVIPVRMDGGTTKVFEGYRVQHFISRGPAKGGVRSHPTVNPNEVRALAAWVTFRYAVVNIPYDGGKDGTVCDPDGLSENEIRAITRRYTAAIAPLTGPEQDIPAPDVGTNAATVGWMMDTYSMLKGHYIHDVVIGKPICLEGVLGGSEATGRGVMYITKNIPNKMGIPVQGTTVAIQEMGNVDSIATKLLHKERMKTITVSNVSDGICDPEGLNVPTILGYLSLNRKSLLKDYNEEGMSRITSEELLGMDARVLVPAVLENQINASNAHKIHAEIIVEAASGPVAADADGVLQERGITVVPDVLANVGGVAVSYLEWIQDIQSVSWTEEEVDEKLEDIMGPAFETVWDIAKRQNATLRTDAYLVAIKRVMETKAARAIWP